MIEDMRDGAYRPSPDTINEKIYTLLLADMPPDQIAETAKCLLGQVTTIRTWIKHGFRSNTKKPKAVLTGQKMRACIGIHCQGAKKFSSEHAGNRLCPKCSIHANKQAEGGL